MQQPHRVHAESDNDSEVVVVGVVTNAELPLFGFILFFLMFI